MMKDVYLNILARKKEGKIMYFKIRREHPKTRKIFDMIADFCNRVLIVSYILMILLCLSVIIIPTLTVFLHSPEDARIWIASIVGGIFSIVVVPIFINYLNNKQKKDEALRKTLFEENKSFYEELSEILVELLANEYSIHKENISNKTKAEKSLNAIVHLKDFLCENYSKLSNTFSVTLIWDIVEVCQECSNTVTAYDNIQIKAEKCFRTIRKETGAKGKFYVNNYIIKEICTQKEKLKNKDV